MRKMITLFAASTLLISSVVMAESGSANDVLHQIPPRQNQVDTNDGPAPMSIADATPAEPQDVTPSSAPEMKTAAPESKPAKKKTKKKYNRCKGSSKCSHKHKTHHHKTH